MLTQEYLKQILSYDPDTGIWTWLVARGPGPSNRRAGRENGKGYIQINIDKKTYQAHRLAFLYMTGKFPEKHVDHINNTPSDNRWVNMREATNQQNVWNRGIQKNNSSGYKGVHLHKPTKKWLAQFRHNGKHYHLGLFSDRELAYKAYAEMAEKHHGEFLHD